MVDQKPMQVAELFFGRSIAGREPLSEAEWMQFSATTLSAEFPDGFTVVDGKGQWRDPASGRTLAEDTKIVIAAGGIGPAFARHVAAAADTYKKAYRQQSVGILVHDACGAF